jgi:hypothetical protein
VQKLSSLLSENAKINKDVSLKLNLETEEVLVDEFENADQYIFMVDSSGSYDINKTQSFLRELANKLPKDKPMLIVPHGTQYSKGPKETNSTALKDPQYLKKITDFVMTSNEAGEAVEREEYLSLGQGRTKETFKRERNPQEHFDVLREQLISCLDNPEIKNTTLIFNIDSDGKVQKKGDQHYVPNHPRHGTALASTWDDLEDEIIDRGKNKSLAEQLREKNIKIKFITMGGESLGNALKDLMEDKDSKAPVIQIIPHTEKGTEIKFTIQKPVQTKRIRFTNI